MKSLNKLLIHTGHAMITAALILSSVGCSATTTTASPEAQLMFVQSADAIAVDPARKSRSMPASGGATALFIDWIRA